MPENNYLDTLNEQQRAAVVHEGSPLLILAGAGSGKTRVITTKIAYLIKEKNIDPWSILSVTFTKKAAGEMYKRIYDTLSFFAANEKTPPEEKKRAAEALEDFSNVHIQTLDSYCKRIVEQAATRYGITPDFTVGSSDSESDIKNQALPFVFENRASAAITDFATIGNFQNFADNILSKTIINNTSVATPLSFFSDKKTE